MNSSETSPHALPQTEKLLPDRKVNRRLALVVIALGLLIAGRTFFFGQTTHAADDHSAPPAPPPPKVTVAPVEESTLVDQRELLGRVDSMETVEVRPRVSGHIDEVRLPGRSGS